MRKRNTPTPEALALAARIRRWREGHKMSKATFARMTGYDPSTITRWEQGENPGHAAMIRIAGAFGVDLATFFGELPDEKRAG